MNKKQIHITKKLKAFTIVELLVTMVITSIVVGLASSLYLNMQQYYTMSESGYGQNTDIIFVTSLLKNDMEQSVSVHSSYGLVSMQGKDNIVKEYDFSDDYIIRKIYYHRDTFFVKTQDLEIINLNSNSDLVSEIKASLVVDGAPMPLHLYKDYTRDVLFNLYQNKE